MTTCSWLAISIWRKTCENLGEKMAEGNSLLAIPANTCYFENSYRFLRPLKKAWAVLAGRDLSRSSSSAFHSKWNYCLHYIRSAVGVFEAFLKISKEVTLSLPFSNYSGVVLASYCSSFLPGQNLWALPLVTLCWDQEGFSPVMFFTTPSVAVGCYASSL